MIEELTIFFFLSLVVTALVFAPCKLSGSYLLFWLSNLVTTSTGIGATWSLCNKLATVAFTTSPVDGHWCSLELVQEPPLWYMTVFTPVKLRVEHECACAQVPAGAG